MYAELIAKTNFSFLTGASHPEELVERAAQIGLKALGINDRNGVYGLPKAYNKTKEFPELKLIAGSEVTMLEAPPLILLPQNRAAYGVMCRILSKSQEGKPKGEAFLTFGELESFSSYPGFKNLLAFIHPYFDHLPKSQRPVAPPSDRMKEIFESRLHVLISRFKDGHDQKRVESAIELSHRLEASLVATNDVLYHAKSRRPLQDALSCVREGTTLLDAGYKLRPNAERYLKSDFEMQLLFKDFPEALEATIDIADSCQFSMSELKYRYPSEWIPKPHTAQSYLEELAWKGAEERYNKDIPHNVIAQLQHEFYLIDQLKYADYFLTIYDIVDFARKKDILCQGRGAAANSAVCFCLGITAVDPVRMNLLFERFISVERGEPPDIDVDFEHDRREEVIQYIYEKYGRDRAGMVSAIVTYQKRSSLRELSKAFGLEVGTLSAKAVEKDFEELVAKSPIPSAPEHIAKLTEEMHGFPRHISIHSGGFTLSADPIIEIVPIEPARMEGRTIIQWDKYDLDYLGLLKVDILALGMLSALKRTLDLAGLKLHEVPAEDKETYKMIQKADTVGTFQVESRAQMNMSGRLQPRNYYDLVIQIAIVRPGPIVGKMVHPYLKRRQGLEKVDYPHPKLKEILQRTLGVPLFQEQIMKMAIELAGFQPGEADQLRRAIGAWRSSGSIHKIGEKLLLGLRKNGVPDDYANLILEQMKGFAHYGFPESHSASFALLAYASCYVKRHFPTEFLCGLLNSLPMGFYSGHTLIDDAKRHGVKVLAVDPNLSNYDSRIENGAVRLGLRVIKGLAKQDAEEIVANRPYASLADFLAKTHVREDVLHRLAMGDAFRNLGGAGIANINSGVLEQREALWQILADNVHKKNANHAQLDLFSGVNSDHDTAAFSKVDGYERIRHDYSAFGLSAKEHPMAALRKVKKLPRDTSYEVKRKAPKTFVTTSGLLLVRQRPPTANGVCFAAIEDENGFIDMILFRQEFEKFRDIFLYNCFLIVSGVVEREGHSVSLIVKNLKPLFTVAEEESKTSLKIEPTQYFW